MGYVAERGQRTVAAAGYFERASHALHDLGLQVGSAQISTFGERVVDVFYVKDVFGMKVDHPEKLQQIDRTLLAALRRTARASSGSCSASSCNSGRYNTSTG